MSFFWGGSPFELNPGLGCWTDRKRAGSLSDLSLTFVPTVWGSVLEINIDEPPGYDMSAVRPECRGLDATKSAKGCSR